MAATGEAGGSTTAYRIDVHHHIAPPAYVASLGPDQIQPPTRNWSLAKSIEDMDRAGVATALVSITAPGLWLGDAASSCRLARACNEYAARLAADHPGRFGSFAALPLPDIEGSLREIDYALDTLGADGIALFTSYGGRWLGDLAFAPVLDELDRRGAVVYTHPTVADCCRNLVPDVGSEVVEYGTDTTRAIAGLVFSGSAARYRNMRMIFSHAGGTMPYLVERFVNRAEAPHIAARLPHGVLHELQRFFYDTAQSSNPAVMSCLNRLVSTTQILFGTDFPYRSAEKHVHGLRLCGFSEADLLAIERDNARRLLPRLSTGHDHGKAS